MNVTPRRRRFCSTPTRASSWVACSRLLNQPAAQLHEESKTRGRESSRERDKRKDGQLPNVKGEEWYELVRIDLHFNFYTSSIYISSDSFEASPRNEENRRPTEASKTGRIGWVRRRGFASRHRACRAYPGRGPHRRALE